MRSRTQSSTRPSASLSKSALGGAPNDAFERHAGRYLDVAARIEERFVFAVAQDQVILAVIERERFGDAFDRDRQSSAAFTNLPLVRLLKLDRRVAEDAERLGHSADFVGPIATRHVDRRVSRREPAHRTGNSLDWLHHLGDHIPRCDQNRPQQRSAAVMRKSSTLPLWMAWPSEASLHRCCFCAVATRSVTSLPSCKTSEPLGLQRSLSSRDLSELLASQVEEVAGGSAEADQRLSEAS